MKFLCLGYYDAERMDSRPKSEIEAVMSQCMPRLDEFYGTGQVLLDAGLEVEARSVHSVDGAIRVADGRAAKTNATIGSVSVIEARDMEDAIRVASKHPSPSVEAGEAFGWIMEIRPIHTFRQPSRGDGER